MRNSLIRSAVGAAMLLSAATASAVTINLGVIGTTPQVVNIPTISSGLFLDTINFELADPNTLFSTLVETTNIQFFSAPIFENVNDTEVFNEPGGVYTLQPLTSGPPGFHLHPQGLIPSGTGSYSITLFASPLAAVPLPAAVWLMFAGIAGLGTLARRKRSV